MENQKISQTEIAKKIQACLKELGIAADVTVSEHEVIVHGQKDQDGGKLRIISQISDRSVSPAGHGPVLHEVARARLNSAVIRPSLGARSFGQQGVTASVFAKVPGKVDIEKQS